MGGCWVDFLTGGGEWGARESRRVTGPRRRLNDVLDRVGAWIDARRQSGRGIPVWEKPVGVGGRASALSCARGMGGEVINMLLIMLQTGGKIQTIPENDAALKLIQDAVTELAIERGGTDTVLSTDPDPGLPCTGRFHRTSMTA